MLMRWMRKLFVLGLAALGVQYLRVIAGVIVAELRPRSVPMRHGAVTRADDRVKPAPRRLVISTFEPHGAL